MELFLTAKYRFVMKIGSNKAQTLTTSMRQEPMCRLKVNRLIRVKLF